jgi:hypothetical protein
VHFDAKLFEAVQYIISFSLEVTLKGELRKNCLGVDYSERRALTFSCFTYSGLRRGSAAICNLDECQVKSDHQEDTHG